MTMTNDELRALAGVLQFYATGAGRFTGENQEDALMRAADYLRAQADAQPVAWLRPENRVEEECTARTRISIGKMCPPIGTWQPLYAHPAPAEPSDPYDAIWNALQEIDSVAVFLPTFAVKHEGGIEAFTKNIVEAINDACKLLQPQAEPMADSDADYWLRNRQPILDAIERAGFILMSNASGFWLHPRGKTDAQAEHQHGIGEQK